MIKKLQKPSYKFLYLAVALLFLPTAALVFYALHDSSMVLLPALSFMASAGIFLFFQFQLTRQRTQQLLKFQEYWERSNLFRINIEREQQAISAFHKRIARYSLMKDFLEQLSGALSLEKTIKIIIDQAHRLFGDPETTIILYLFHSRTGEFGISRSQKGETWIHLKDKKGDIYDQWVVNTVQSLLIEDIRRDFRFDHEKIRHEDTRSVESLMGVPLISGHKAIGLLRVDDPRSQRFSTEDLRLLGTVGDLGAVAIENAQLYEHLEDLAIHDGLTGLYVRRHFLDRLAQEILRQQRRQQPLAFLMMDLDFFKAYNDTFGHVAGDTALRTVGRILQECLTNREALLGRYGGEEFAVAVMDCSHEQVMALAEDIRKRIEQEKIVLRRQETSITVSVGVAVMGVSLGSREELIQKADVALYRAKQNGRNRVCLA